LRAGCKLTKVIEATDLVVAFGLSGLRGTPLRGALIDWVSYKGRRILKILADRQRNGVLQNVTFAVIQRAFFGVLVRNGLGKNTLIGPGQVRRLTTREKQDRMTGCTG